MSVEEQTTDSNKREWRDVKRQAGCLWGCLSEPFVIAGLMIASLFGAYTFGRAAERARKAQERSDREQQDD